ncbi:hypothetical protein B0H16DRAFT_155874 [Mycena metata]|uniref:Uncharacterized protein n=1 Tax=Mycena metata TaxID=1033252 RepID=A0AAD7I367_9AGAR|nr:hypothetical protein B0H16DRAFT_155874 [Mycena metata]
MSSHDAGKYKTPTPPISLRLLRPPFNRSLSPIMRVSTVTGLLVGFLAHSAFAVGADQAVVPGGYRSTANIHEIPAGGSLARVGTEIRVIAADGTVVHTAPVPAGRTKKAKSLTPRFPWNSGWVTFAFWHNTAGSPISSFATTWEVPPVPETNHGQTVFLFNAIEPSAEDAILQPVLQYGPSGAGGGAFWAVASWYVGEFDTFHTTVVPVSTGTILNGLMTLTGSNATAGTFDYNSQFTNIPGTSLNITGIAELTVPTETLEAYSVSNATDVPAGSTVFSNITLEVSSGVTPALSWSQRDNDAADGFSTTIEVDGPTDAQIRITY